MDLLGPRLDLERRKPYHRGKDLIDNHHHNEQYYMVNVSLADGRLLTLVATYVLPHHPYIEQQLPFGQSPQTELP